MHALRKALKPTRLLAGKVLEVVFIVVLFQGRKTCATVILRAATALLVTEMLSGIRCEETFECNQFSEQVQEPSIKAYRRAPHSHNFASSLIDCLGLERAPPDQQVLDVGHWW